MRIALCYSGLVRNFHECLDSHSRYLIEPYKPDVFIHTWSKIGSKNLPHWYNNNYSLEKHINEIIKENNIDITYLLNIIQPKKFFIEYPDINYFYNQFYHNHNPKFFNCIMMHYSINQSNNLKKQYEINYNFKYDLVIRCRFDSYFDSSLDISDILPNTIYLPPNQNIDIKFTEEMISALRSKGPSFMPNDQFAYGCSEAMDYYCSIYDIITKNNNYYIRHPEGILTEHLWTKNNSQYKNIQINNSIKMKIQSRYWK